MYAIPPAALIAMPEAGAAQISIRLRVAQEDLDTMALLESNRHRGVRSARGAALLILAGVDHYSFIGGPSS